MSDALVAERARLILPKLIEYMEKKEAILKEQAKMAIVVYDDLVMTRAATEAILKGKHNAEKMQILGLWDQE